MGVPLSVLITASQGAAAWSPITYVAAGGAMC